MALPATLYARFSSLEQGKGTSLERQFELTRRFAEQNGWDVSEDRLIADEAASAFHGANRQEGKGLWDFEQKAEQGYFRNGHVLVVEHLDRISRQGFNEVWAFINRLTAVGVTVATATGSGTIYHPFEKISLDKIIRVLVEAEVAQEESSKKSIRQIALWEGKLKKVREGQRTAITKLVPEWVVVDPLTKVMTPHPYRSEVVCEIFQLSIDGYGSPAIANLLNKRGEETWAVYSKDDPKGRYKAGDKRAGRGWTVSYVDRLLQNPAVMGEYRPMRRARSAKLAVARGERFLDYYPQIIDPHTFAQAQEARERRVGKGGKIRAQQVNIFSGLAHCSVCGDTMGYIGTRKAGDIAKGTNGSRKPITYVVKEDINYLQCNSARRNFRCTNKTRIRYEHLEAAVLDAVLHMALDDTHFEVTDKLSRLNVEIAEAERSISEKQERLNRLIDSFSRTGSEAVERSMLTLDGDVKDDVEALEGLRVELQSAQGSVSPEEHQKRVAEVRVLLKDEDREVRYEARRKVHQAFKHILRLTCSPERVTRVTVANGLAAFELDQAGELLRSFNLSGRLDLHRGLTSGELAKNKSAVASVLRRTKK